VAKIKLTTLTVYLVVNNLISLIKYSIQFKSINNKKRRSLILFCMLILLCSYFS